MEEMETFRSFLGSRSGLIASILVAALGVYLIVTHTGQVLGALPYLLLLLCPLMHLFGHHSGHHHGRALAESERNPEPSS